jgi:hypothetical protein
MSPREHSRLRRGKQCLPPYRNFYSKGKSFDCAHGRLGKPKELESSSLRISPGETDVTLSTSDFNQTDSAWSADALEIYLLMIIVRILSPEPVGWLQHHQLYSGLGADTVMESMSLGHCVFLESSPNRPVHCHFHTRPHAGSSLRRIKSWKHTKSCVVVLA